MKYFQIAGAVSGIALFASSAFADGAALIIGAKSYTNAPDAVSAERDANAVAGALEDAGYKVVVAISPDRATFREALTGFAAEADSADKVVIFYSGHALRMAGDTFLAPSDAASDSPVAVGMDTVPLSALLALAAQKPGAAVVFIDGAERSGFTPSDFADPGIADITAPDGVLIISAAAPGEALSRSRWWGSDFAKAVTDRFLEPGVPAMDVANGLSEPFWVVGEVDGGFALADGSPGGVATDGASDGDISAQIELAFWQSAEASGSKADYQAYLSRYPDGSFAAIARNRIGSAASSTTAPPATPTTPRAPSAEDRAAAAESALNLSRDQRRSVQQNLTELGYDTNGIDGLFGRGTRGALRSWQGSEDLPVTGYLTRAEVTLLQTAANEAVAAREAAAAEAAKLSEAEAREQEDAFWIRSRRVGTIAAYQRYLTTYPDGAYTRDARTLIARATRDADNQAWREATELNSATAYDRYLDQFPDGQQSIEAQRRFDALSAEEGREGGAALARKEAAAWQRAEATNTAEAYTTFQSAFPDGHYAEEAQTRAAKLNVEQARAAEDALNLDQASWQSVEQRLAYLGFDPGPQDGKVDRSTRNAIRDYRRSRSMEVSAYVDNQFVQVLVQETSQTQQDPRAAILNGLFRVFQQ